MKNHLKDPVKNKNKQACSEDLEKNVVPIDVVLKDVVLKEDIVRRKEGVRKREVVLKDVVQLEGDLDNR